MITVDRKWLGIGGIAPTEADVDIMLARMDEYAKSKNYANECNFRQYWTEYHEHDMVFVLMKDYE